MITKILIDYLDKYIVFLRLKGYSTIIILIGLFILFSNNYAIALETNDNIIDVCRQVIKPNSSVVNVNNTDNILSNTDGVVTAKSPPNITQVSLWWAAEQFDPFNGKLVRNWFTQPKKRQINLVVNWQLWTLLEYFDRYRFVNQFGTVVRKYGYSLNIFNQTNQCLASYKYNPTSIPPKWELNLVKFGRDSLPIEP